VPFVRLSAPVLCLALVVGCASKTPEPETGTLTPDFTLFTTESCPQDAGYILPEKITIEVEALSWGEGADTTFAPVRPVAIYELTSEDARIGGLSGLDFLDDDTLISVTDKGDLVWMDIETETGKPAGSSFIAFLKSSDGKPLDGKILGDAEGIAWNGAYAFVSFERDHRILGYDLEACGANARGIEIIRFTESGFGGDITVKENGGLEALAAFGDGLITGLETRLNDAAGLAYLRPGEPAAFDLSLPVPGLTLLVGADVVETAEGHGRLYALTRSYDPLRGNQIGLVTAHLSPDGRLSDAETLLYFGAPFTVDNFEGIAVQRLDTGTDRIFIISDDNFSDRQRSLFGVLEYEPGK
jgi:hypothetical protein